MKQKYRGKRLFHRIIIYFLLTITALTVGSVFYFRYIVEDVIREDENFICYDKHIVIIVENKQDTFWQEVYESARKAGEQHNCYIELFGEHLPIEYSKQELLKIAVDASVDGIIIAGDDSKELVQEIARAEEKGIPVVTVLSDSTQSTRECFVGINSYQLGQTLGKQIARNDVETVCVLMNRNEKTTSQNIIYSGISEALGKRKNTNYQIYPTAIQDEGTFGAEETIRTIFLEEKLPDILICLDQVSTTSACQAVVDFNKVGDVEIIGCYSSNTILQAIDKKILQATVAFDTQEMGEACVSAFTEYWEKGHVSEYKPIAVNLITKENVGEYVEHETNIQ